MNLSAVSDFDPESPSGDKLGHAEFRTTHAESRQTLGRVRIRWFVGAEVNRHCPGNEDQPQPGIEHSPWIAHPLSLPTKVTYCPGIKTAAPVTRPAARSVKARSAWSIG